MGRPVSRLSLWAMFPPVLFGVSSLARAQERGDYYGPHMMWEGGWYGFFFGPLMMILFIVVAVAVVIPMVRWLGGTGYGGTPSPHVSSGKAPLDILKERFARGEIDKEEFDERRRVLGD